MSTQLKAEGALWHYNHNDAVFEHTKGWDFDTEHLPSALFTFTKVMPQVQVKVDMFWSSDIGSGFPFGLREVKEKSVFANFIHQLAVVVVDDVKMEEFLASKGPIHFKPETVMANTHSTGLRVLITRAVEGRAQLAPAAITGEKTSSFQSCCTEPM